LRSRDALGGGFAIHCARYVDGQGVGIIPTAPAPQVDVNERSPGPGENFLDSDLMALIRENHVVSLNCGRNAGSLSIYLQHLFRKAGLPDESRQFELVRIGSPDKLGIIQAVGVKSIDLDVDIAEATGAEIIHDESRKGVWNTVVRNVSKTLYAITSRDKTIEQLRSAESGTIRVSINVPAGDLATAKHGLDGFAADVVEDDEADAFVIHLRNGATIKPEEISVRRQVRLEARANSVSAFQAWDAMELYMDELEESGQLEA
jgi:hypothetical protein